MEKSLCTGVIVLDLQKTFGLLIIIYCFKIKSCWGLAIKCFSSISVNHQFIDIHGIFSAKKAVRCGVPQGSILGPLLFTLYVNDMSTSLFKVAANFQGTLLGSISFVNIHQIEANWAPVSENPC